MNIKGEGFAIIFVYVLLTIINIYGFKKLSIKHESNFHLRYLFKKIGIIPTQILTIFLLIFFVVFFPLDSFIEGLFFGVFIFNLIHDYYTIMALINKKGEKNKW